jgi:hypothetical protein
MDLGGVVFFGFLAAIIIVPQVLRYKERGRLHQTLRMAFERGQPVPPELIAALQWGRRRPSDYDLPPEVYAGWQTRTVPPAAPAASPQPGAFEPEATPAATVAPPPLAPVFAASQHRRDVRRGVLWLAVGLGLFAAGGACYAGLYDIGGAQETLSLFSAAGTIPFLIGLTYLALAWLGRDKTKG